MEKISKYTFFSAPISSLAFGGISLASIGTVVGIVAGLLGIVLTCLKIYEWFELRRKRKSE